MQHIEDTANIALFLDFDGTLVEFSAIPSEVFVSRELITLLQALSVRLDGALALISGRSISSLKSLLNIPLAMSGSHGAQWCYAHGPIQQVNVSNHTFAALKQQLLEFAANNQLMVEDKGGSIALHYRQSPEKKATLDAFINEHLGLQTRADIRVVAGNCVREVQPVGVDKGKAVARFMHSAPFRGRMPVYVGDDTTDEDAFAWVNGRGGVSVKVGSGETCANNRLADIDEVLVFLQEQLKR